MKVAAGPGSGAVIGAITINVQPAMSSAMRRVSDEGRHVMSGHVGRVCCARKTHRGLPHG